MKNVKWCQFSHHFGPNPLLNLCISLACLNAKELGKLEEYYALLFGKEVHLSTACRWRQESQGTRYKDIHFADENNRFEMSNQEGLQWNHLSTQVISGNIAHFPMPYPFFQHLSNNAVIYIYICVCVYIYIKQNEVWLSLRKVRDAWARLESFCKERYNSIKIITIQDCDRCCKSLYVLTILSSLMFISPPPHLKLLIII